MLASAAFPRLTESAGRSQTAPGRERLPVRKLLLLLLLVPGLLVADVVYLKGGGRFSGRILEQTAEKVVIDFGDGTIGLPMDQVEKIVRGTSPLDEFDARASKLGPQDVDGWRSLALWASTKGLSAQSRAAYKRVLALAPDDKEAREALGFVQVDGRWLTEEESYRARGFVKYDGEWMTPAEVQLAQSDAAREQARDEADKRASDAQFSGQHGPAAEARGREACPGRSGPDEKQPRLLGWVWLWRDVLAESCRSSEMSPRGGSPRGRLAAAVLVAALLAAPGALAAPPDAERALREGRAVPDRRRDRRALRGRPGRNPEAEGPPDAAPGRARQRRGGPRRARDARDQASREDPIRVHRPGRHRASSPPTASVDGR